jgi:biopolymer transport protein TolR
MQLSSPSSRRNGGSGGITLNLVPILDAMVTLIGFLLFTTSFLAITSIETPMPQASTSQNQEQLKEKPLQLTLSLRDGESEIWSPFDRVPKKIIPSPIAGQPDLKGIHETLLAIKKQFPYETKIVLVPYSGANYETLVAVMDTARIIDPTDPPLFRKNQQTNVDEPVKQLFPDIIFGNLLGDSG